MNVKFEKGRNHSMDTVKTVKEIELSEKDVLQKILTDAGVEFNKTLGVAKLQILVDELEEA
jgi:hypothetical protein